MNVAAVVFGYVVEAHVSAGSSSRATIFSADEGSVINNSRRLEPKGANNLSKMLGRSTLNTNINSSSINALCPALDSHWRLFVTGGYYRPI
jgi:hypothetical protein